MTSRIALWDNLKCFLITAVVLGHFADMFTNTSAVCQSVYLFIYAFHMPLFFYIPGMFYREGRITAKIVFYVSVGMALKITLLLTTMLTGGIPSLSLLSDPGIPWFMFVLAIFTLIAHVLRNQNKRYILIASVILACFAGYDEAISDYLCLSRAIVFFPFFWAGTMTDSERWIQAKSNHKTVKIFLSAVVVAFWAYLCFRRLDSIYALRDLFVGRTPFSAAMLSYGPLVRLLCYGISTVVGASLILLTPMRMLPFITRAGTRTIDVYFWHWPAFMILAYCFRITDIFVSPIGKAAYFLLAVALSGILSLGGVFRYPVQWMKRCCFPKEAPKESGNI